MNTTKLLAITSLPTVGNAGLKNMMSILKNDIIPVPSVLASGLGNMDGFTKVNIPFEESLKSSIQVAKNYNQSLIVYVGYLVNTDQIDIIKSVIDANRDVIKTVIIDPVCGDNGKAYIDETIIKSFDKLLSIADIAIPNETELRLLSNNNFVSDIEVLIESFQAKYPNIDELIITSVEQEELYANVLVTKDEKKGILFRQLESSYSGTGDLFAALFVKNRFFNNESTDNAITKSAEEIGKLIAYNIYNQSPAHDIKIVSTPTKQKGRLNYVIGPSGVGKDTLLDIAKSQLKDRPVVFVKRYITRPADAGGESHIELSVQDFKDKIEEDFFALWWESHGNYYGIPSTINTLMDYGYNVVVNGSRGYYDTAAKSYPDMNTILITAKIETIRQRLLGRGRESVEEVEKRLERSKQFFNKFENKPVSFLSNDGSLEESSLAFIKLLEA